MDALSVSSLNPVMLRCTHFNGYQFRPMVEMAERTVYDYEIEYYIRSGGAILIDGKRIPFSAGEINIRKPGQIVQGMLPYECLLVSVDMRGREEKRQNYTLGTEETAQPLYQNTILSSLPDKLSTGKDGRVLSLMQKLYRRQLSLREEDLLQNKIDLLLLLQQLYELSRGKKQNMGNQKIRLAVEYIQKNYMEEISISRLIQESKISKSQFHKLFLEYTGYTPNQMLTELRLRQAKLLLTTSLEKIGNIAVLCGYYDHVYFSYLFQKETGLSPSAYRSLYFHRDA